jgi:putative SOS response-associated peptidase YedK
MCGRFLLAVDPNILREIFALIEAPAPQPRYNIAPTQPVLAVRQGPDGSRTASLLRWGLVPSWAREIQAGSPLINARSETAAEKPAFRTALRRRRCLVPANGFYEWQRQGRTRQPFCFRMAEGEPFAFAGLWEQWASPDGKTVESCAILTTEANELVRPVHDRMPVIVPRDEFAHWLHPSVQDPGLLQPILRPFPAERMRVVPVSTWISDPRHEGPCPELFPA